MDQRLSVKERPNKIVNRLGYWTSRRHEDYQAKDGLSRDCDWSMKLKRPRMAMVADLEEERMGKKRQIVTEDIEEEEEEEDFNMNFVIKQDVPSEVSSFPLEDELVFKVENENFVEIPEEHTSDGSEDLSDSYYSYQFKQETRKFHFTNLKVHTSVSLDEENVDTVDIDMMDEDDKDAGEGLAVAKQPEPEELTNAKVKEEEHNSFSESVLEKIAALKRIDEKLLNIEKEKGKRLKTALSSSSGSKKYGMYQNPRKRLDHSSQSLDQRNRRTGKSRNRDASSSSSSISSSDSSSSSNDESTSENEESVKRNASGQEADDLRNKLKQYLTKLKRKGVKKT